MANKFKKKKISIEIEIKDLKYLELCFNELIEKIRNGNEEAQRTDVFFDYKLNMEYSNRTDYIEKKIDGNYYLIFKPKKK